MRYQQYQWLAGQKRALFAWRNFVTMHSCRVIHNRQRLLYHCLREGNRFCDSVRFLTRRVMLNWVWT